MKKLFYKGVQKFLLLRSRLVVAKRLLPSILRGQRHLLLTKECLPENWPQPCDGPRVHFGCGRVDAPGWINIDAYSFDHVSYKSTDVRLSAFAAGSLREIYLCHTLEHFSFHEAVELLKVYFRKLGPGGRIRISVPDFDAILQIYADSSCSIEAISESLFGGQDYEYNYHKSAYNSSYLSELLVGSGFRSPRQWSPSEFIESPDLFVPDWSVMRLPTSTGPVPISLNLVAYKPLY